MPLSKKRDKERKRLLKKSNLAKLESKSNSNLIQPNQDSLRAKSKGIKEDINSRLPVQPDTAHVDIDRLPRTVQPNKALKDAGLLLDGNKIIGIDPELLSKFRVKYGRW